MLPVNGKQAVKIFFVCSRFSHQKNNEIHDYGVLTYYSKSNFMVVFWFLLTFTLDQASRKLSLVPWCLCLPREQGGLVEVDNLLKSSDGPILKPVERQVRVYNGTVQFDSRRLGPRRICCSLNITSTAILHVLLTDAAIQATRWKQIESTFATLPKKILKRLLISNKKHFKI